MARASVVHKGFFEPWTFDSLIHSFRAIREAAVYRAAHRADYYGRPPCGCDCCVILRRYENAMFSKPEEGK